MAQKQDNNNFEHELKTATTLLMLGLIPYIGALLVLLSIVGLVRAKGKANTIKDVKRVNVRFVAAFVLLALHVGLRMVMSSTGV